MRVISNTSPLIALAQLDKLNLLEQLFNKIVIPKVVYEEFLRDCPSQEKGLIGDYQVLITQLATKKFFIPNY